MCDFDMPFRVYVPLICELDFGGERMEEVKEFYYFGTVLSKHGDMEEGINERVMIDRSVIEALGSVKKERNISMVVKKGITA